MAPHTISEMECGSVCVCVVLLREVRSTRKSEQFVMSTCLHCPCKASVHLRIRYDRRGGGEVR